MKLVVIEPLGVAQSYLENLAAQNLPSDLEIVYYDTRVEDTPSLIERGKDADIILLANLPFRKEVLEACTKLKMIAVAFTGVDHVDMDYCRQHEITVCNCAGYSTIAVADLVFGMVISLYRNIIPCNETIRKGGTKAGLVGYELAGKKFGIVGTGAIGLRTAAIAKAFGCEVYAYSRTVKNDADLTYVDLDTLLSTCDIVSLHVPLTKDTQGLINKEKIALMKPNAILINTARGPVVDSQALADALNEGKIAGAGIDVFENEPPIPETHPLCTAKNALLTPHVAFATKEALEKRAVIAINNIASYLNGTPTNVQ